MFRYQFLHLTFPFMVNSSWKQVRSYRHTKLKDEASIIDGNLNERILQAVGWKNLFSQYSSKKTSQRTVF